MRSSSWRRLHLLEKRQREKAESDNHPALKEAFRMMEEIARKGEEEAAEYRRKYPPVAPEDEHYVEDFNRWYDKTFRAPTTGQKLEFTVRRNDKFAMRKFCELQFANWWDATYPDERLGERYRHRFKVPIERLLDRIYSEVVEGEVPINRRRYYFDPDNWMHPDFRAISVSPGENNDPCRLWILVNPKGDVLKRARELAREWKLCRDDLRCLTLPDEALDYTPLEWFRRQEKQPKGSRQRESRVDSAGVDGLGDLGVIRSLSGEKWPTQAAK